MEDELKLCDWICSIPCRCILGRRRVSTTGRLVNLSYDRALVIPGQALPELGSSVAVIPETEGAAVLLRGRVVFLQESHEGLFGLELSGPAEENCSKLLQLLPFVSCPTKALRPGSCQRRKFSRWGLRLPVSLRWESATARGRTLNLSLTGARVQLPETPLLGSEIRIWLISCEQDFLVGRVIHTASGAGGARTIGIEFLEGTPQNVPLSLIRDQIESSEQPVVV